jgi:hypothetical protein
MLIIPVATNLFHIDKKNIRLALKINCSTVTDIHFSIFFSFFFFEISLQDANYFLPGFELFLGIINERTTDPRFKVAIQFW